MTQQFRPEEVMESLHHVLENGSLSSMEQHEFSQFIMKISRSMYVNPELATRKHNEDVMKFQE